RSSNAHLRERGAECNSGAAMRIGSNSSLNCRFSWYRTRYAERFAPSACAIRPMIGRPVSGFASEGPKAQGATPLTERQITPDHGRAIAETRGSIGMAFLPNLERYVDGLKEMADVVGVDPDSFPRTTASR